MSAPLGPAAVAWRKDSSAHSEGPVRPVRTEGKGMG